MLRDVLPLAGRGIVKDVDLLTSVGIDEALCSFDPAGARPFAEQWLVDRAREQRAGDDHAACDQQPQRGREAGPEHGDATQKHHDADGQDSDAQHVRRERVR